MAANANRRSVHCGTSPTVAGKIAIPTTFTRMAGAPKSKSGPLGCVDPAVSLHNYRVNLSK